MGLYAEFTPEDLDYKLEFSNDRYNITVEVDYTDALEECAETFLQLARQIVPVDTGFLRSTLYSEQDGLSIYFEATAEYAEFVEYGTWKQRAQPYFRPALEEALRAFIELADLAQAEAEEEFNQEVEMAKEEEEEEKEKQGEISEEGGEGFGFGSLLGMAGLFVLLFPIILNVYGFTQIFKEATEQEDKGSIIGGITGDLIHNVEQIAENLIQIIED